MLSLFTLPSDALSSTTAYIGSILSDVGGFVWLAVGIPLGFYVIRKVISLMPKR